MDRRREIRNLDHEAVLNENLFNWLKKGDHTSRAHLDLLVGIGKGLSDGT
jgi:hypothetical protein